VLYGAAGVAHHPELTRLLLERGADPNDAPAFEVPYHAPETYDNRALQVLVESGRLSSWSLNMMLVRKADWHDEAGAQYLLEHGADPEDTRDRGWLVLHHAIARDNSSEMIRLLLDHGANPLRTKDNQTASGLAARRGRSDLLRLFTERGFVAAFDPPEALVAACALEDDAAMATLRTQPATLELVRAHGGRLIVEFAGNGNSGGVSRLIDLGTQVDEPFVEGDGYWGVAPGSTALMNAAWRIRLDTVDLLLQHGAKVNATNDRGDTALDLALRACTTSYWAERRQPRSIAQLLDAGADAGHLTLPTGYPEADALIRARRT
jgi:ankyrin repeat protein